MENHEEDELEELRSTVYTFPPNVQNVIEQVKSIANFCLLLVAVFKLHSSREVAYLSPIFPAKFTLTFFHDLCIISVVR